LLYNDNVFFICDVHGDCPQLPLSGTRNIQNAYMGKLSLESCKKIESDYKKCMLDCMIACRKANPQDEQRPSGPRPAKLCSDQ